MVTKSWEKKDNEIELKIMKVKIIEDDNVVFFILHVHCKTRNEGTNNAKCKWNEKLQQKSGEEKVCHKIYIGQ